MCIQYQVSSGCCCCCGFFSRGRNAIEKDTTSQGQTETLAKDTLLPILPIKLPSHHFVHLISRTASQWMLQASYQCSSSSLEWQSSFVKVRWSLIFVSDIFTHSLYIFFLQTESLSSGWIAGRSERCLCKEANLQKRVKPSQVEKLVAFPPSASCSRTELMWVHFRHLHSETVLIQSHRYLLHVHITSALNAVSYQ